MTEVYKKDVMDKNNCRTISVLPNMSQVFEKVMIYQLTVYMNERARHTYLVTEGTITAAKMYY